jgi:hypothetical protein
LLERISASYLRTHLTNRPLAQSALRSNDVMPPVRIYTDSPINAAKASGQTPETKAGEASSQAPATTTSQVTQGYAAAQPGAVPSIPAPTGSVQTCQYAPLQPTPTRNLADQGPPPPQPGAVPLPPAGRAVVPPPPRAGEAYHAPQLMEPRTVSGIRQ